MGDDIVLLFLDLAHDSPPARAHLLALLLLLSSQPALLLLRPPPRPPLLYLRRQPRQLLQPRDPLLLSLPLRRLRLLLAAPQLVALLPLAPSLAHLQPADELHLSLDFAVALLLLPLLLPRLLPLLSLSDQLLL